GLYLWHEAWIGTARHWRNLEFGTASIVKLGIFVLVTSIATAAVSYYLIERPALRLKRRAPWSRAPAPVAVAAGAAGAASPPPLTAAPVQERASAEPTVVEAASDPKPDAEPPTEARRGFFARWDRFTWTLLVIVAAGFTLRLVYILPWRRHFFATPEMVGDAGFYPWGANFLTEGKGFINVFQYRSRGLPIQDAGRPPLYMLWLYLSSLVGLKTTTEH